MIRTRLGVALVLVAVWLPACRQSANVPAPSHVEPPRQADKTDTESIFALDVPFVDQNGVELRLADLAGHPLVMTMIYTRCTSICPRVTQDLTALERALGPRAEDVRFVLFSLDPGRDTPQALQRFACDHHLNLARWRLLATPEDGVRDLAAVFGVKYALAAGGEISHSAMIIVADAHGVIRYRQIGVGQDQRTLLDVVHAL